MADVEMKSAEEEQKEAVQVAGKGGKSSNVFSVDLLRLYYEFLFPYDEMYRWLSYDAQVSGDCFKRREFSFTIENDIYIRYLSFAGMEEMKKEIKRKQPHKIDIGAVYTCPPKDHNTVRANAFKPVSRELVFDIDLTDYNEFLRNEESDPLWAYGSWQLMAVAIKTLDMTLREDFGFQHLLWVFSGRRGVHCWVCDEKARQLTDRERAGLVGYLTVVNGNESSSDRVALTWPLHPFVQKILPTLRECFESKLLPESGQDLLKDPKSWDRVLKQIPDIDVQKRLRHTWERETDSSSTKKWAQLKATVQDEASKYKAASKKSKAENLEKSIPAIILLHTYARLDVNVSTHRNHLLKSPFVIHPKTGKVCVPILDIPGCDRFDPDGVPTLVTLTKEINDLSGDVKSGETRKQTSLWPYLEGFNKGFLDGLYQSLAASKEQQEADLKKKQSIKPENKATLEW